MFRVSLLITVLAGFLFQRYLLQLHACKGQCALYLFWLVNSPQSVRQKVRKTGNPFPLRRRRSEAMIESSIDYKIFPDRVRDGPQIPEGISAGEWLREVPEFACDCQRSQWV